MPNISMTLPETIQSITRPIVFDIIDQVQAITKIDKTADIFFPGDTGKMQTPGTNFDSTDPRFAKFSTGSYLFIEVEEDFEPDVIRSTAVNQREHLPVFVDKDLGVHIAPVYATTNITINFKYRTASKTEAFRWRDDMRTRISQARDINLHDLTYHYSLPVPILEIIEAVYDKREAFLGYGQTLEEYVISHATDRLTLIGDLVAKSAQLAISETQARVIGMFTFDSLPDKPERDDDSGCWVVSFGYKFSYEKPIACNAKYPVIVHNQILPPEFVLFNNKSYDLDKINKSYSGSIAALNAFEATTVMNNRVDPNAIIRLPNFDDYVLPSVVHGTGSIFIALAEVDINDSKTLFNLNELGDIIIDSDILNFIKTVEYPYICNLYQSIIHISLYRNNYLASAGTLECDASLNIKAKAPLDLRKQYRARFSLVVDLTLLGKPAIDRLRNNPKVLVKIISGMNELLKNHPDFVALGDKKRITMVEFSALYRILTGYAYDNGGGINGSNYYGCGLGVHSWPYNGQSGGLFLDIDPRLVENYRNNRVAFNTVQVAGIISASRNN